MKHTFLKEAARSPWVVAGFVAIGVFVGVGIAFAVMTWMVPRFTSSPAVVQDPLHEEVQEETPSDEETVFTSEDATYRIRVDWDDSVRVLTNDEALGLLTPPLGDQVDWSLQSKVHLAFQSLVSEAIQTDAYVYQDWQYKGMWEVGTVESDPWKGASVYHLRLNYATMGGGYRHLYLIHADHLPTTFVVGTVPEGFPTQDAFVADLVRGLTFLPNATIEDLEMPEEVVLENGEILRRTEPSVWENETYRFDEEAPTQQVARTKEGVQVYEYRSQTNQSVLGCLYLFAPDGRLVRYRSFIPRAPAEQAYLPGALQVQWDAAYTAANNTEYREYLYGGCGAYGCTAIVSDREARAGGGLVRAGVTVDGDLLYVPTRPEDHPIIQALYDEWFVPDGKEKPPIEAMLEQFPVPIFFWQDAFGRWVQYRTSAILPPGECGKPVIYLYPEQETNVSVRLPSFIHVTVSDPAYPSAGWRVTAQPSGQLISHADGNTYGSLFWEGTGVGYTPPTDGFVVKEGEVETFLADILPQYGLNETETREFMEFWVPEMTGAPYYRVSFLTSAWSAAAPLEVLPHPQTSIRFFMDWRPLSAPVSLSVPTIVTPERNGFTLVEWGGTLWE